MPSAATAPYAAEAIQKNSVDDTNFHVRHADVEVINGMIDLIRKLPAAIDAARPAHARNGGIELGSRWFAFALACLDGGVADCSLQTPGQSLAFLKSCLPADLFQQFRGMVDGVGCNIAVPGHASGRHDNQPRKKKCAKQGPRRFSHGAFTTRTMIRVSSLARLRIVGGAAV